MLVLKLLLILAFGLLAYQDVKDRAVSWVLFPAIGLLLIALYAHQTTAEQYLLATLVNMALVSLIIGILWLYTRVIAHKKFLNTSFGLGDLLFFYAFALGFPTLTFIVLFACSLLFSLLVFLLAGNRYKMQTIPLAGLMGMFLIGVLLVSLIPNSISIYLL